MGCKNLRMRMEKYNIVKIKKGEIMYLDPSEDWQTSSKGAIEYSESDAKRIAIDFNRLFSDLGGEHYNYLRVKTS